MPAVLFVFTVAMRTCATLEDDETGTEISLEIIRPVSIREARQSGRPCDKYTVKQSWEAGV